eukprot:TRINITY_DN20511_c0_g1_i1.p1 TRINITY_DN20511_c0_g1~~TRINITY_DN20511_c0_g1_i1.p1  ORF type:complete len:435 (-),score=30.20 TRINITY_DN20511_c0_g1_i1:334-1638(-)
MAPFGAVPGSGPRGVSLSTLSSSYALERGQNWAADCKALQACKENARKGSMVFWPRGQRSRQPRDRVRPPSHSSTSSKAARAPKRAQSCGGLPPSRCPANGGTDFGKYSFAKQADVLPSSSAFLEEVTIGRGNYGIAVQSEKELSLWPHPCSYSPPAPEDSIGQAAAEVMGRSASTGSISNRRPSSSGGGAQMPSSSSSCTSLQPGQQQEQARRIPLICPSLQQRGLCRLPHCPYIHEVGKSRRVNDYVGAKAKPWEVLRPCDKVECKDVPCRFLKLLGKCVHGDDCVYSHEGQCEQQAAHRDGEDPMKQASAIAGAKSVDGSSASSASPAARTLGSKNSVHSSQKVDGRCQQNAVTRATGRPSSASRASRPGSAKRGRPNSAGSSRTPTSARGTYAAPIRHSEICSYGLEGRRAPVHQGWGDTGRWGGGLLNA